MLACIPEDGDVVVRPENWAGKRVFILHAVPGADQCLFRSCEEAVAHAVRFARRHHVRAWFTSHGDCVLLENFRVRRSHLALSHILLRTRILADYLEMPGLQLTLPQAHRLFDAEWALCKSALDALVKERFLCLKANGVFTRVTDGCAPPPVAGSPSPAREL